MRVTRSMHKLVENVDNINYVKSSDDQVNELTNQTVINAKIREMNAILIIELQMLFHGKRSKSNTKLATIRTDVKNIFAIIEKGAFGRVGNFEVKKIF